LPSSKGHLAEDHPVSLLW